MAAAVGLGQRPARLRLAVIAGNLAIAALVVRGFGANVLALVIVVPLVLFVVQRPQRGVLALVALAPLDGLLNIIPHPSIIAGWKEGLAVAVVLATFVCPREARAERRPLPPWWPALAGLMALSVLTAVLFRADAATVGLKVGFFFVLAYIAVRRCPLSVGERDRLVTILMVVGGITALYGIAQQAMGGARLHDLGYDYNGAIRFSGSFLRSFSSFRDPFGFGFFMMVVLLVCLPVALQDPHRTRNRLFLLVGVPIMGVGVLTTLVRGAWLGLAVGIAFLGMHRYRILLLAIPLGLTALILIPPEVATSALSSSSTNERVAGWSDNLHQLVTNPLGSGVGSVGAAAQKQQDDLAIAAQARGVDLSQASKYQPDNYYFLTAYQLGPIGLWLLVLLLLTVFHHTRNASRRLRGPDQAFAAGVSAMVLGAIAASFVATYLEIFPMDVLWWVLIGVVDATVVTAGSSQFDTVESRWT
jgi:hypothetical protein